MSVTVSDLLDDARALSEGSRIDLAERILETLDYSDEVMRAHLAILDKRIDDVKSGRVELIPGDQVFREADDILKCGFDPTRRNEFPGVGQRAHAG